MLQRRRGASLTILRSDTISRHTLDRFDILFDYVRLYRVDGYLVNTHDLHDLGYKDGWEPCDLHDLPSTCLLGLIRTRRILHSISNEQILDPDYQNRHLSDASTFVERDKTRVSCAGKRKNTRSANSCKFNIPSKVSQKPCGKRSGKGAETPRPALYFTLCAQITPFHETTNHKRTKDSEDIYIYFIRRTEVELSTNVSAQRLHGCHRPRQIAARRRCCWIYDDALALQKKNDRGDSR